MDENKVFDLYFELPDGYEVQLMVLRDYPGGRTRRGAPSVFRSRVWIGHVAESDPLTHKSQEHPELNVAVDSCYSMLLQGASHAITSPAALEELNARVHSYFHGIEQVS
ncbi:MAG TPA: hypothetical protein VNT26_24895 [Candidatus Sulfotelmatobacter sp.]|nr:hypothetical protein [Candidatus Sulfotelmatobacter sp.]HWI65197.1 hypothetical protein [Symbiobacteriaceae bacterium]